MRGQLGIGHLDYLLFMMINYNDILCDFLCNSSRETATVLSGINYLS